MKNRKKPEVDRWKWIESINDPNDIEERQLLQTYCFDFPRCKQKPRCLRCVSPFCLHNLGEKRWDDIDREHWTKEFEDSVWARRDEKWVGLENLGGTCYINSCLQFWFHNPFLRELLFQWNPEEDREENEHGQEQNGHRKFNSLIANIQYIFASMRFSLNGVINVQPLVDFLDIDPKVQQDFEEFSSLLRNLIQECLKTQSNLSVKNMMQEQFIAKSMKSITCSKCGETSQTPETFYELILSIQKKKDLYECLDLKFGSENMEGNNQYACKNCGLQDAVLSTKLTSLPSMLCIQFMRFGFGEGVRQKLTDCIRFPEILDLDKYLTEGQQAHFDLVSVLIHMGRSSKSGHFIDCIKEYGSDANSSKSAWYTFNDATVHGPFERLNLYKAEEEQPKHKGKIPAGCHASSNAYILWYKRREPDQSSSTFSLASEQSTVASASTSSSSLSSTTSSSLSSAATIQFLKSALDTKIGWPPTIMPAVREAVEIDNMNFVETFKQSEDAKNHAVSRGTERQKFLVEAHENMWAKLDQKDDFEFIGKTWLKKGLFEADKEEQVDMINNKEFACKHDKLDPHKVLLTKVISKEFADTFCDRYKVDGPRFSGKEAMCRKCVTDHCRQEQLKNQIEAEKRTIRTLCANYNPDGTSGFWVGKRSFMQWANLAGGSSDDANGTTSEETETSETPLVVSASTIIPDKVKATPKAVKEFNEDLRCAHRFLEPQKSVRKLVPRPVWDIFLRYFPNAESFPEDKEPCETCVNTDKEEQVASSNVKKIAQDLKKHLADFIRNEKRPDLKALHDRLLRNQHEIDTKTLHVIPRHFVTQLQQFLKSPGTDNQPVSMSNVLLLCPHRKMMYNLEAQAILDSSVDVVWAEEYASINAHVNEDARVTIRFIKNDQKTPQLQYVPELCVECSHTKLAEKKRQMYEYQSEKIYVRKLGDRDTECKLNDDDDAFKLLSNSGSNAYENDPEFQPGLYINETHSKLQQAGVKRAGTTEAGEGAPLPKAHCSSQDPDTLLNGHSEESNGFSTEISQAMGERKNKQQNGLLSMGQFQHALDEMGVWLGRADAALDEAAAPPAWSGGDAKRIEIEIAKHKILANDIAAHQTQLDSLNAAAKQMLADESAKEDSSTLVSLRSINEGWRNVSDRAEQRQRQLEQVNLSLLGLRTSFGPSSSGRLSSRVRKRRHDKEIEISSGETLKDLKKKIFTEFQIAAFDQNLFFEESKIRLDGDEKTLGELGVTPHSLILVRGDKPRGEAVVPVEEPKEERDQAGFNGTKLVNVGWSCNS